MASLILTRSPPSSLDHPVSVQRDFPVALTELGSLIDAIEPFKQAVMRSKPDAVRLYCTVPMWNSGSSGNCLDLHDLHQLRTRFLVFIHDLLQTLRSSGVAASYALVPSNSSRCIVCAGPTSSIQASAADILQKTPLAQRQNVLLADLGFPCLIIT
ncbi:hypothetical protein B0H10DRAFT_2058601 [Mycena sp. CBHHK59/15]|nr:hypothetical protein B0H10DRAFT_2058601 [Mycena sp. CBHHK59/15]